MFEVVNDMFILMFLCVCAYIVINMRVFGEDRTGPERVLHGFRISI